MKNVHLPKQNLICASVLHPRQDVKDLSICRLRLSSTLHTTAFLNTINNDLVSYNVDISHFDRLLCCELSDTVKARKLAYYGHTMRKRESCMERERDNARNNARFTQARTTTHGMDGQHQDVDRTHP